ncbi:hypothetical protein RI129_001999 [Pyrocoelia pectoralis]|uniref:Uncharacterized protein n=1 Tax=Pyrocoelia pectoralis TaxID=417401 RepID=A0AAN7VQ69_9COLE
MSRLSMETVQRLESNNQIPIIQDTSSYLGRPNGIIHHYPEHNAALCYHKFSDKVTEEPIDLTCNEKRTLEIPIGEFDLLRNIDTSHFMHNADDKKIEVLKAAKSLFSKRTRTLYHWMYPNAPKAQLKAAIAASWETLSMQEKEFYISQVLGRFGFPQSNLMINPQLGGISGTSTSIPIELSNICNVQETSNAVSTIINEVNNKSWMEEIDNFMSPQLITDTCKKNRRTGKRGPLRIKSEKHDKEEISFLKAVSEEVNDEFKDDPELNREFQQFRRNIHLNSKTS